MMTTEIESPVGTLRITLGASKSLYGYLGSYRNVFARLAEYDQEAFFAVAAAGLGKTKKEVEPMVFAAGLDACMNPFSEFVGFLSRGGRPLPKDGETQDATPGEA